MPAVPRGDPYRRLPKPDGLVQVPGRASGSEDELVASDGSHPSTASVEPLGKGEPQPGRRREAHSGSSNPTTEPTSTPRLTDTDDDRDDQSRDPLAPAAARALLHAALKRRRPSPALAALRERLRADPRGLQTVLAQCELSLSCLQQCEQARAQLWAAFAAGQRSRLDALTRQAQQGLAAIPHVLARAWCPQTSADVLGFVAGSVPCELLRRLLELVDDKRAFLTSKCGPRPASCRPSTQLDSVDHDLWAGT